MSRLARLALIAPALVLSARAGAADWLQFGYDAQHSGHNSAETAINAANVASLAGVYGVNLSHSADSAPVFLSGVATAGGTRDLLFVVTKGGYLLALDALDGHEVWSKRPTPASGSNLTTGSPAIDPDRQSVYAYGLDGYVHKYAVGDGEETTTGGWPQLSTLKPNVEKGAAALAIASVPDGAHYLYSVTDGYIGDGGDYQGHVTTIDLASGAQRVFNTLCSEQTVHFSGSGTNCDSRQSGIWGRPGAVYDAATQRIYVATGNGRFNAHTGGHDWADSVLALAPDGTGAGGAPLDSYTPTTFQDLQNSDRDLGSVSPAIVPAPAGSAVAHLGLQAGKDGKLRLFDLDDMSGAGAAGHVGGELQLLDVPQGGNGYGGDLMREQPAVWVDPSDQSTWVFVGNGSGFSALQVVLDGAHAPSLAVRWTLDGSANGSTSPVVANGVLYSAGSCTGGPCVTARDPHTGTALWHSGTIGSLHWHSLIVVNGAVYVVDNGSKLWKFALPFDDTIFANGFDG